MAFVGTTLEAAQKNGLEQDRYLENRLLEMIKLERENFPFHMLGKNYTIPANKGTKYVQFRRYLALPQFTDGHALTEGVPPTQPLLTEAVTVAATVAQYGAFMKLTDVQEDVHIDNIKNIYQPELSRHAAELIERNVITKLEAESSIYFVGNVPTVDEFVIAGVARDDTDEEDRAGLLTLKDMRRVALYMKNQLRGGHTKFGGKPVVVVHPNIMADLLDDLDLKNRILTPGQENRPIVIGSLNQYEMYGIYIQEALIAPVHELKDIAGIDTKTTASHTGMTADQVYFNSTDGKYYKALTDTTWEAFTKQPGNVYVSFMLGKDPYIVTSLANGSVEFKSTGYEATKDDPLGQFSTVGYKLWTGAKVVDPFAITAIYSFSAFDTYNSTDYTGDMDASTDGTQTAIGTDTAEQSYTSNYA